MNARSQIDVEHSYIASMTGSQGCHLKGTKIFVKRNNKYFFVNIEDVLVNDKVVSLKDGVFVEGNVINRFCYPNSDYLKINLKHGNKLSVTPMHKLFTLRNKKVVSVLAKDLEKGDMILRWRGKYQKMQKNVDYYRGVIHGAYIADGGAVGDNISKLDKEVKGYILDCAAKAGIKVTSRKRGVGILRSENLLRLGSKSIKRIVDWSSLSYLNGVVDGYINCDFGANFCMSKINNKKNLEVKIVSKSREWIEQLQFLVLFFYGCSSNFGVRILKSGKWKGNKYYNLSFSSQSAFLLLSRFEFFGEMRLRVSEILSKFNFQKDARSCYNKLPVSKGDIDLSGLGKRGTLSRQRIKSINRCINEGYLQDLLVEKWINEIPSLEVRGLGEYKKLFSNFFAEEIDSIFYGKGDVYDIEVEKYHNYVLQNGVLSSNSGKSFAAITACSVLDPNFSVDNIFFDYNELIYNRKRLKPHTAVLVDEQSESYGVDSHRVNIILNALKEQLRKKSIHFFFCSPTLKEEYHSSHYVIETMFIDYEERVTYCAYKTRELLTLGYIKIPHPENFVNKKFLMDYEKRKDEHLDKLTGVRQVDEIEERAKVIMNASLFKKAEIIYKKRIGYIPMGMLFQIINKLYPEFRSSIIVGELATRIKLDKELSGEWVVSGAKRKKS